MVDNPFLPLSFIAGPAILTNASTVLLNGASIRYNLAVGLWRDLQAELLGGDVASVTPYLDRNVALRLAHRRVSLIVTALNLLYFAVAGFALSTLTGLTGALQFGGGGSALVVYFAKTATVIAAAFGLICLLGAATVFTFESRCSLGLLKLGTPKLQAFDLASGANETA